MTVRVRFAPSPTGEPHIGNIRTVVFNWLFARKMGGQFILRIEDTDRVRYQPQSIPVIMEGLRWLGLDWDEGEPHVIRLKVPLTGQTVVHDIIKGDIVFENAGIDDQVLLKSDGFPTYHLAVVVDDHYMKITHIARGDDWISSTPKRILIYRAMGWEVPTYCHVPLVLGEDGRKLSKRHGATSITEFRDQGYLPEALFNFLALLGWSPGGGEEREIFSRKELIERFDLFRVNRAPAIFSYDKLDWMNGVYIRKLSQADLLERLLPFWQRAGLVPDPCPEEMRERLRRIVPLVQERLKRLDEVVEWTAFLFREIEAPPAEKLVGKRMTPEESLAALRQARSLLAEVEPFEPEAMEPPMRALAAELGLKAGQLFGIVRWAVTGQKVAPPLFGSLAVLGRERVLARLDAAEAALLTR